jgi:type IV secretion system protein VirD4
MLNRVIHTIALFWSRLSEFFPNEKPLHPASFPKLHELKSLIAHTFEGDSFLNGIGSFNTLLRIKPKDKTRPELGNILDFGTTGAGKTTYIITQLLNWEGNAIVNDIKWQISKETAGFRSKLGKVFFLDVTGYGHQFDPFRGRETEDKLYAMAKQLLYDPHEGDGKIFTQRAMKMLTQIFLAARVENRIAGFEKYHLLPYVRPLTRLELKDVARRISSVSPELAIPFLDSGIESKGFDDKKFLMSAWESLTTLLYPLLTENIVRCFDGSDFTIEDMLFSKNPVTVYLRFPEADLLALSPIIRLVWDSLMYGFISGYDKVGGKNCQDTAVFIDEAGRTEIPHLYHYISTVRSRKITMHLSFQSPSQIDANYGKDRAEDIWNNCETQIFRRPASMELAYKLQHWLGDKSGFAASESKHEGAVSSGSSEREIPLMTAQEIKKMDDDDLIVWHRDIPAFRAKNIKWWEVSLLRQRQAIPAPEPPVLPPLTEIRPPTTAPKTAQLSSWHTDPNLFRKWTPRHMTNGIEQKG